MQNIVELVSSEPKKVITNNVINLWCNSPQQIRDDTCFSAIQNQLNGEIRKLAGNNFFDLV